ncbi:hypothetical protein 14D047_00062 [Fowlpox virus]|nr:hypothetical protein 13D121_00063 [Fowlpox virus]URH25303.1 hypothetical protein 14D047_00062 [Fowlpox virus]URH25822.1 hypothetical protein 18Q061_00062 [Fowlpox virus]URH26086.1 hypothetical protein 18R056_00063 [Fowlpox virus]URH26349.1 hypothetical protein 18R059_00063 [Fowlpox virus]
MISTYTNILSNNYSLDRFMIDEKNISVNRFRFDRFLSKFGNIINIRMLNGIIVNKYTTISLKLHNSHLLILVLDLPDNIKLKVGIDRLKLFLKRLSARYYMVINSSEHTNHIVITTVKINNNEEEQYKLTLGKKYKILICYYDSNMLRYKSIEQNNKKALLVGCGFIIGKWYIEKKKTRVVKHSISRITKKCITSEYYLDRTNIKVTDISSINAYWICNPIYHYKYKISDILKSKNKSLIQALRWPLGKPSITFFRLWIIGEYGTHNINLDTIVRILKRMTGRKITNNCGLGDILIYAFGIVRKQANKLGLDCKRITFRNFWKEVASIQLIRYNKYKSSMDNKNKQNNKVISPNNNQYKYLPFNPWMLDISKEVELWDDLKLNLLDKNKWYNDWPVLSRA